MSGSSILSALTSPQNSITSLGSRKITSSWEKKTEQNTEETAKQAQAEAAKTEFLDYAKMNPAERIRAAYLKEHNLTEEELAALPEEKRDLIEEEIKQTIKKQLGLKEANGAGQVIDITV
ncbi:MAG: hypothetical protein AB7E52_01995 [Bdellovibrionales bacterium]